MKHMFLAALAALSLAACAPQSADPINAACTVTGPGGVPMQVNAGYQCGDAAKDSAGGNSGDGAGGAN
jgi:hypothetical protein